MAPSNSPIKVGGPYVENENHVPNPTDMVAQYNTEGVGAHQRIEEVSPIFEVDKAKTAQEIVEALDPDSPTPSSRVLLPEQVLDNDTAREEITAVAEARLAKEVVIGGPTPAEREAAEEGEEGERLAVEQEANNSAANSTGNRTSGQHDPATGSDDKSDDDKSDDDAKSAAAKKTAAKKSASSNR